MGFNSGFKGLNKSDANSCCRLHRQKVTLLKCPNYFNVRDHETSAKWSHFCYTVTQNIFFLHSYCKQPLKLLGNHRKKTCPCAKSYKHTAARNCPVGFGSLLPN